jgi:hypothetical protein
MKSINTISINFCTNKNLIKFVREFIFLYLVSMTDPALTKFGSWWWWWKESFLSSNAIISNISGNRSTSGNWKAFFALILFFAANSTVFSYKAINCIGVWIVSSTPLSVLIELLRNKRDCRRSEGEFSLSEPKWFVIRLTNELWNES